MAESFNEENFLNDIEYHFSCNGCGACCTGGPGYVFLSQRDIDALADFLSIEAKVFLATYCREVDTGSEIAVSLKENKDFSCVFLRGTSCGVYAARPLQCRSYPFWQGIADSKESWLEEKKYCPGIDSGPRIPGEFVRASIVQMRNNKFHSRTDFHEFFARGK